MIRLFIKILFLLLISINSYANLDNCKNIYQNCFENIPEDMVTFHQELNIYGVVNKNDINISGHLLRRLAASTLLINC